MRDKYLKSGFDAVPPHEMLEMLLYATNSRCDTNPIAHNLINTFGSFSAVLDAPFEELCKVDGVGESTAFLIKLIPASARVYLEDGQRVGMLIRSHEQAFEYLRAKYVDKTDEMPSALFLDNKGKLLAWDKIGSGSLTSADISVRKLVELSIRYQATAVILCHNHPSGVAIPSRGDCITTKNIIDALKLINVRLVDHLILASDDYVSMAESAEFSVMFS
ncbi:MAG: DNA repair protein RadC [Clostridia bacterium]|nr:DNA repair protein RadC [Clostridia bacterium]